MTTEEYYKAVGRLNLRKTNVPTVFVTPEGDQHNVPTPDGLRPEQLREIIEILRKRLQFGN
jgi:hypothetical protein